MHPDDTDEQRPTRQHAADPSTGATSDERRIGRHRAPEPPRRGVRTPFASVPARIALAGGVTCCLGLIAFAGTHHVDRQRPRPVQEVLANRAADEQRASRARDRAASPPADPASASPHPPAARGASPTPTKPGRPRPVAGLTPLQMDNAKKIVDAGVDLGVPRRGMVVAVATAMQESDLHNLASDVLPESYDHPHQGSGSDHDSVGLFQQRPSSGWGTVAQLMRPDYAARAFYAALAKIPGWRELSVTAAAQAVQISAYPRAYARHEQRATTVVAALT
ncbi:hypothetical protein [Micromonospora antibiotica]|uniref:Peptidase M23 n=1 Tax=Micromonospora antibiotica TaxID=2807623 RepID=A0ABS3V596_9ACTN|nr:hypothetical protein [Micromonospora antibiotica]MBO4160712.1 hypothetical protein [Micromonospora antibiotica]